MARCWTLMIICILFARCEPPGSELFSLLPGDKTGVTFANHIFEDEKVNIINEEYLYNGGGVAAADFNNDGLTDLFFTGNMVDNQLYLNNGDFKFQDISDHAGVQGKGQWKSGVALIDINNDDLIDIYVCASIADNPKARTNSLYVNQGVDDKGLIKFVEQASKYGIADESYSSNAVFFDYDNDGDQDLFILVNSKQSGLPTVYKNKVIDGSSNLTDKLYRNNGDQSFTEVSDEAGILVEGHGLGVSIIDINEDGWSDLYIANDFLTNDVLYVNHEGKFVNEIDQFFKHQSRFSMGTDAADINNDGKIDLITVDMMPEINTRKKTVIQGGMYINYINDRKYGYTHQYTRNMLQVNNGNGTFSELGQFSGVHQTEWSWSPLLADFDNDGYRDLLITNGFPKDITDKDFINFRSKINRVASAEYMMNQLPSVKVPNYAFRNNGDRTFEDVSRKWGIIQPSFSNGAAYADLDNDGDLDYIVNNIDDQAFIYRNNTISDQSFASNYIRIELKGPAANRFAQGAKVEIFYDTTSQVHLHSIYRGYISTVEPTVHFGLGATNTIDSITIIWPDRTKSLILQPLVNQELAIDYEKMERKLWDSKRIPSQSNLFERVDSIYDINYAQKNYDIVDYSYQSTIPHKFSQYGPAIAVGDINLDGKEDLLVGSRKTGEIAVFKQNGVGTFSTTSINKDPNHADAGLLLFDADNDDDLDLYVVSGGFEKQANDPSYQDRFYRNDQGAFTLEPSAIPTLLSSGSVARAADIDNDGDIDLFVAGRVVPHNYPVSPESFFLINENGSFTVKEMGLGEMGMISDAIWTDFDNDGDLDLITCGEFSAVNVYQNTNGDFSKKADTGLEEKLGWWNSITSGDFDNDGDIDYVCGNYGLNNSYNVSAELPLFIHALDIDNNGSVDPVLSCYTKFSDGSYKLCPVNYWEELSTQSPVFRRRFTSYKSYGNATIDSVLTADEMARSQILKANHMESSYVENLGDGKFEVRALPLATQIAPVNGIIADYVDDDDFLDIVLIGNDYGNEIAVGDLDALNGMVLLGDGSGGFVSQVNGSRGFYVPGDGKALARLTDNDKDLFIASQNKDELLVFEKSKSPYSVVAVSALETSAHVDFKNGSSAKFEFPYGCGFYSQSSRKLVVTESMKTITFFQQGKETRKIQAEDLAI